MKRTIPICRRCKVPMKKGEALQNGLSGLNDFATGPAITVAPNPKLVALIPCWKCPKCGHSIGQQPFIKQ